jgi:DNA repair protein RecN (Recombination protein N)
MLSRLTVSNLAVVEKAEVEFDSALNVLTGETGAGKSVLMGALELVLGARADTSIVRDGAKEARVEAVFSLSGGKSAAGGRIAEILDDAGLPPCENGELIVRRSVSSSGSGKVWVNDSSTTVATLRRLGEFLADIHGPRANQLILEERFQRETLDSFAGASHRRLIDRYSSAWEKLRDAKERLAQLGTEAGEDEADVLRFQIAEISEAGLSDEDETLSERHAAAAHAVEIAESANEITEILGGDGGAAEMLIRLGPKFNTLSRILPAAAQWAEEAEDLTLKIQELSRSVMDAAGGMDPEGDSLEELDRRLSLVNKLKRKYGGGIGEVLAKLESKRRRLDELEHRDEIAAALQAEIDAAGREVKAAGAELTRSRKAAAAKLSKAVTGELRDLGFLQAGFGVAFSPAAPEAHGCDAIAYMFEPNPGESARMLADVASSGEIARVMLAIKGVLSAHDSVGLLVFDEIDANLGGEAGRVVGAKMKAVSARAQVIAITHLPQSAVYGDRHLVVSKAVDGGRTRTVISEVEGEDRVSEIARMLGGEKLTSVVRKHANELLQISR